MSEPTDAGSTPLFSGDLFKRFLALLISLMALLVALSNFLHADALSRFSESMRDVQRFGIQAIGLKARGEMEAGYAYADAFRLWFELDSLSFLADERGKPDAAERYRAVRDSMTGLTPLLAEPYFDPAASGTPNIAAFEADEYLVETTVLSENFGNTYSVAKTWRAKADAFRNQLILFALALFLYGLSNTFDDKARWILVGAGSLIANVGMVWMVAVLLTPVSSVTQAAVSAYARGVGMAHQEDYQGAIEAFDQALAAAPDYANAYYERGNTYYELDDFDQAIADYEAALAAGRTDLSVPWNLGWTYYIQGRLQDAIRMTHRALEAALDQVGLHFNLGVMYLATGDLEAAQAAYDAGMAVATRQVTEAEAAGQEPPESLWWYMGTAALDLSNLLNCLYDQVCRDTPSYEAITAPKRSFTLKAAGEDLRVQLKTLTTALEYTGRPSVEPVMAHIGAFQFARGTYDDQGEFAAYAALDSDTPRLRFGRIQEQESEFADISLTRAGADEGGQLFVFFDYEGMQDGQLLIVKVYVDGEEAFGLRLVEEWSRGPQGQAALPLTPAGYLTITPGDYRVEIYVDSQLVQQGQFTVESP